MINVVDDKTHDTGVAIILNGDFLRLVQMIEVELPWLPHKDDIVRRLKELTTLSNPLEKNTQRQALEIWNLTRGAKRSVSMADRAVTYGSIGFVVLGSLGGFIYLIRLIVG